MVEEQIIVMVVLPCLMQKKEREVIFQNLSWWGNWTWLSEILPTNPRSEIAFFLIAYVCALQGASAWKRYLSLCKNCIGSGTPENNQLGPGMASMDHTTQGTRGISWCPMHLLCT